MGAVPRAADIFARRRSRSRHLVSAATARTRSLEIADDDARRAGSNGTSEFCHASRPGFSTTDGISSRRHGSLHGGPTWLLRERLAARTAESSRNAGLVVSSLP